MLKPRWLLSGEQLWADQVSHCRFFSLYSLFPICFHRCKRGREAPFREAWPASVGGWALGLPQKNCSQGNYPWLEECSHQFLGLVLSVTATGLGSRSKCGRRAAALPVPESLLKGQNLRLRPRPVGPESALLMRPGIHTQMHSLRSPEAETHKFLLPDRWQSLLSLTICVIHLHTGGTYRAI